MIRRPPSSPLFPSTTLSRSPIVDFGELAAGASKPYRMKGGRFYAVIIDTGFSIPPADRPDAGNEGVSYDGIPGRFRGVGDRKSTRLNSSHLVISYAVFCLKK